MVISSCNRWCNSLKRESSLQIILVNVLQSGIAWIWMWLVAIALISHCSVEHSRYRWHKYATAGMIVEVHCSVLPLSCKSIINTPSHCMCSEKNWLTEWVTSLAPSCVDLCHCLFLSCIGAGWKALQGNEYTFLKDRLRRSSLEYKIGSLSMEICTKTVLLTCFTSLEGHPRMLTR
jgi:hypothetical protein